MIIDKNLPNGFSPNRTKNLLEQRDEQQTYIWKAGTRVGIGNMRNGYHRMQRMHAYWLTYKAREPYNWAILARGRIMKNCRPILKLFAKKVDETPLKWISLQLAAHAHLVLEGAKLLEHLKLHSMRHT